MTVGLRAAIELISEMKTARYEDALTNSKTINNKKPLWDKTR